MLLPPFIKNIHVYISYVSNIISNDSGACGEVGIYSLNSSADCSLEGFSYCSSREYYNLINSVSISKPPFSDMRGTSAP